MNKTVLGVESLITVSTGIHRYSRRRVLSAEPSNSEFSAFAETVQIT